MKEVLHEEEIGQPRRCFDGLRNRLPNEPWRVEIHNHQYQEIDGPDTKCSSRIEVAKVVFLVPRLKENGGNQKAGEDKEQVDARLSPQAGVVDWRTHQPGMAVIDNHCQYGEAAQPL